MWKNYVWIAVATLVPLGFLIGLLVFAPRDVKPVTDNRAAVLNHPQRAAAPLNRADGPAPVPAPAPSFAPGLEKRLTYVPSSTKKVCQLTGDLDHATGAPTLNETGKKFGIVAADRGASFEHKGQVYFLFDSIRETWDQPADRCALAWTNSTDPDNTVLNFHTGPENRWLPPALEGFNEATRMHPTGGVSIGDVMYVVFKVNQGCVLATSQDDGRTFSIMFMWPEGRFGNVSCCLSGEWLYLYGRGEFRKSSVYLARANVADIQIQQPTLKFFAGIDQNGQLSTSSRDTDAVPLFKDEAVGDYSVAYIEGIQRYIMLYDSDQPRGIVMREAEAAWGPWSDGTTLFDPERDNAYGQFIHSAEKTDGLGDPNCNETGSAYGPYLIPRFTQPIDGRIRIYYTMSSTNPRQVFLMQSDLKVGASEQENEGQAEGSTELDMFGKRLDAFTKKVVETRGIAGEVVMAGKPVAGATVIMRRLPPETSNRAFDRTAVAADLFGKNAWVGETDAEGKFIFTGLDVGHYGLEAFTGTACGVDDMPVRANSIPGNPEGRIAYNTGRAHMSIELRPSAPLAGRVLAPDGNPVANANVYPAQVQDQNQVVALDPIPVALLSVKTAADGSFLFPRLIAGRWQLAVTAAGYQDQMSDWLPTGGQPVEIGLESLPNSAQIGGQATDRTAFNISDYRGKYVLLDFWAAWCGPCRAEMPNVRAIYEEYKNDPRIVVVGLNLDPDPEDARKYISDNRMGWTHVFLGKWSNTPIPNQYGVVGIPCLFFLDPEGRILARDLRGPAIGDAVHKVMGSLSYAENEANSSNPASPASAQKVLDRLLGTWSWEGTIYTSGSNPEEKHATGRNSFTRVLHGNFVQEMGEDSEKDTFLGLYTYDQRRECYRSWPFLSRWGGPEAPFSGKWNEAAHTLDLVCPSADGGSVTLQHRFVSDDAFECTILGKDMAGKTVWGQEFKFARLNESQNPNQPATGTSRPVLGQTAEQKVLDRFLGTWSEEKTEFRAKWTPEEKHTMGTSSFARILGGRFVQEIWEDTEKKNSVFQMLTYDEQRKCYRTWFFDSNFGGPEAPTNAKWDEATRTLEYFDFPANEGQRPTCLARFVNDDETVCFYTVQDAAGETLYRAEFKMTRMK